MSSRHKRRPPPLGPYRGSVKLGGTRADMYGGGVDMIAATRETCRRSGCRCDVEVSFGAKDAHGIQHMTCRHDDWCPLLRSREDVN